MAVPIACDVHTHTLFSRHAYSTVEEDVRAAAEHGMGLLGITDHFSCMLFPTQELHNFQYFQNMHCWPREWHGVQLLRGCEADIVSLDGAFFGGDITYTTNPSGRPMSRPRTLKEIAFAECDYVVASVHDGTFAQGASRAEVTRMYRRVIEEPKVLVLGHIGRTGLDFDLDEVLAACRDAGVLVEVNESSLVGEKRAGSLDRCRQIVERCAELGVPMSFGSDAHISWMVGRHDATDALLDETHFPAELMACRTPEAFFAALSQKCQTLL